MKIEKILEIHKNLSKSQRNMPQIVVKSRKKTVASFEIFLKSLEILYNFSKSREISWHNWKCLEIIFL